MQDFYNSYKIKIMIVIIITFLLLFACTNTYSLQNIDHLAYVVALGIDVADNNNIKLSIQIAKPNAISSSSTEQSSSSVLNSVECSSIQEGLNLFDSHISRTINLSHCKIIIISENLASRDISIYLNDLANNIQVSSHANIIISKCDASDFLEMTNPTLEKFSARYYDIVNSASISTSFTKGTSLMDFYSIYNSQFQEPVTVLSGINNESTHFSKSIGSFTNKDNSYIAGETPIISQNSVENMGLAVFKDGKLIGELNGIESICHLMVIGALKYCNIQIENPKDRTQNVDLKIQLKGKPKTRVTLVNGFPYIHTDLKLAAQIVSANGKIDYLNDINIRELESDTNSYIEKLMYSYLYKTSKEFNSDIDGFGKYALKHFLTTEKWQNYNWLERYEDSFFKVNVEISIKSTTNFISG